jgi:hypothetical protein
MNNWKGRGRSAGQRSCHRTGQRMKQDNKREAYVYGTKVNGVVRYLARAAMGACTSTWETACHGTGNAQKCFNPLSPRRPNSHAAPQPRHVELLRTVIAAHWRHTDFRSFACKMRSREYTLASHWRCGRR